MRSQERELATEYEPREEREYTELLAELLKKRLAETYSPGKTLRALHPKQHGFVEGRFIVEHDLPEMLRVGVFKEARTYRALIRFSNASPSARPDHKKDTRGMSIKLLGTSGEQLLDGERESQCVDFITTSFDSFFARNPKELYFFTRAFFSGILGMLAYCLNPFNPHIGTLLSILRSARRHTSPLDVRYWSMTPYLFGTYAVKYSVRPWDHRPAAMSKKPTPNYLRENMSRQLSLDNFYFDFMVQFQSNPYTMPIEDPMVSWSEDVSPFRKLATIVIPSQNFDTAAQLEFGDSLSFSPWRSLTEHRPLGGINRSRKRVYEVISEFRTRRNGIQQVEARPGFTLASMNKPNDSED